MMTDHEPMISADSPDRDSEVRFVVAMMRGTAISTGPCQRQLWIAVALDPMGAPAALGLYDGAPSIGDLAALIGAEPVAELALGPQWTFPGVAYIGVDLPLLWHASEVGPELTDRGIAVHPLAPLGPERARTDAQFKIVAKSLAAAISRSAEGRDEGGRALVSPEAAAGAARDWRVAWNAERP